MNTEKYVSTINRMSGYERVKKVFNYPKKSWSLSDEKGKVLQVLDDHELENYYMVGYKLREIVTGKLF